MKILSIRTIEGPNLFHHRPVLSMLLDLGPAADVRSDREPAFVDALLALLPGLWQHGCSLQRHGGFVERLRRGTYLGHIVEHVALELSGPAGIDVGYGKTVATDEPTVMRVVVRYRCEHGMRFLLESAVALVDALLRGRPPVPVADTIRQAQRIVARHALGPSARAIVAAAQARGIPWRRIGTEGQPGSLVRLGWGRATRWVRTAVSSDTALIAAEIAQDKALTKTLLAELQIPVPRGMVVRDLAAARAALRRLSSPLAVKPLAGNHGRGCTIGVDSEAALETAFAHAASIGRDVLIEEQVAGDDHRLLVVGGRLVAASLRRPAQVVGDGTHTLAHLIARENADPRRGDGHAQPLTRIAIDAALHARLAALGRTLDDVPAAGETVVLRDTANLSTGGTAEDVTDRVAPRIADLAVRAAAAVGLDIAGIDFVTPDIGRADCGAVIEVNAGPGLRMHHHPSAGRPRDVGAAIVAMLYPHGQPQPGRIPLVAVTGTNGKTTVSRMIGHVLAAAGRRVGLACTDGVWIGSAQIADGDCAGPASARSVLADPTVEAAVLETARGGIARRGLGFDWCDVGIVTNVQPDHIGQDGIRDIGDLVRIKALVPERVRPGGTVVLNADNDASWSMAQRPRVAGGDRQVVVFSLQPDSPRVMAHLARGGRAVVLAQDWLVELDPQEDPRRVLPVARLPVALGGLAQFNIANALAATAACRALGVGRDTIALALASFGSAVANRGRANLYEVRGGYVLADYGHNADAFTAIARLTAQLTGYHVTGVIDMPGDRADAVLRMGARAAARAFDRVIVHKPRDARGRVPGAVAQLICEELSRHAPQVQCVQAEDERAAMDLALRDLAPGRFAVLFYETWSTLEALLAVHGAVPASRVPLPESGTQDSVQWAHGSVRASAGA
jgi:cyanophycin synthetase